MKVAQQEKVFQARHVLRELGFPMQQTNERSALALLCLLDLRPDRAWAEADGSTLWRTFELMQWLSDNYDIDYAPNARETIRRQTLHQFVQAGLVLYNPDDPARAVNSPANCYQVAPAGGQNILIKSMIEEFCPRWTPGGRVLYVGDAGKQDPIFDERGFADVDIILDKHGKLPDLVVHLPDRGWLVLLEAASSHGPVDNKRHGELSELFGPSSAGLVFVSCFASRAQMRKYLADIAWETEVWCADAPDHLVHFNGERFLGPYE